jgi:hypothetical protein
MEEFKASYPADEDFVDLTAVARVNGYLAVKGSLATLQTEINDLLPP